MCSLFTCNKEEIYTEKAEINIELPKSIESIKSDFQVLKTEASAQNYSDCAVELISPFNVDLDWSNSRFDDVASTNEVEVYRVDVEEDDRNLNTLYRTTQLVILKHLEEDVIYPTLLVYEWEEDFTSFKENSFTGGACLIEPGGYVSTLDKFVDNHLTESLEPDSEQMEYCDEGNARGGIWAWIQALFAKDPGCCPSFPSAGGGGWSNFWSSVGNFFNNLFSSSGSGSGNSWTSGGTGGVFWGNGTTTTTNNNPSGGGGGGNSGYNNNNFYNDPITQVVDAIFDYLDCHTSATGNILNNTITHTNSFVQQVSNTTGLTINHNLYSSPNPLGTQMVISTTIASILEAMESMTEEEMWAFIEEIKSMGCGEDITVNPVDEEALACQMNLLSLIEKNNLNLSKPQMITLRNYLSKVDCTNLSELELAFNDYLSLRILDLDGIKIVHSQIINGVLYEFDENNILHVHLAPLELSTATDEEIWEYMANVFNCVNSYYCENGEYETIDWSDYFPDITNFTFRLDNDCEIAVDFNFTIAPNWSIDTYPGWNNAIGGDRWKMSFSAAGSSNVPVLAISMKEDCADEIYDYLFPECE